MSQFMQFLAKHARSKNANLEPMSYAYAAPGVAELADELAALNSVELRNMLLEERKGASQYKSMFDATPAAMEIDKVKNEAHGNKTDKDSALDDDDYVEVLSAEAANAAAAGSADGPKTKATATGAAAAAAEPALTFKLVPEYKEVAAGPTSVKVVISLQATAEVSKPASVALVAVVDKSGSMQGSKMQLVRGTVEFLAEQLAAQDALGLVTYSDQAKRDLPLLNMTPAAKTLAKAVNAGVQADGCTALLDGLTLGLKEHSTDAAAAAAAEGVKRRVRSVFLCTDGLPNVGPSDAPSIVAAMRSQLSGLAAADEPASVHTFGFGSDHDARLLQAIAEAGHGIYYFIQDDSQIPEAFGDALGGLLSVVASSVRVTVTPLAADGSSIAGGAAAASCSIAQLQHGGIQDAAAGESTGATRSIKFADLFAEESREVLLQLDLTAAAQEGQQALIKVEMSFTHPETGAVSSSSQVLQLARAAAPAAGQARDPLVAATAARFQVAEALKVAAAESEANRFAAAEQHLLRVKKEVEAAEGLGAARQAYIAQLADMTNHIQAVQFASKQEKSMASTRMAACSNSMAQQRCAGVGFTSSAAPLTFAAPAPYIGGLPAPAFGGAMPGGAPAAAAAAAACAQQQQQMKGEAEESVPWAKSNVMRKKMTMHAADYVSKRNNAK